MYGRMGIRRPAVGSLTLEYEVLRFSDGRRLTIYQASPGTPDHDAMTLLSMTAAADRDGEPRPR